jgi:hypothetical protein
VSLRGSTVRRSEDDAGGRRRESEESDAHIGKGSVGKECGTR